MLLFFASLFIAYLIGSIPTGYIFGRLLKRVDIRKHGSGNVGATNVFRVVGKIPGIIVLLTDILKGLVTVTVLANFLFTPQLAISQNLFKIILGLTVITGHNWTIFLKFKGGKGIATSAGVLIGLEPVAASICFLIWVLVFIITHYVSLSSIVATLSLPIVTFLFYPSAELLIFSLIICLTGVYKHRSNIKRLLNGTESKISFKKTSCAAQACAASGKIKR